MWAGRALISLIETGAPNFTSHPSHGPHLLAHSDPTAVVWTLHHLVNSPVRGGLPFITMASDSATELARLTHPTTDHDDRGVEYGDE